MLIFLLAFMLLGAVAGVLAGLFGIGGGLVIVPTLSYLFGALNIPNQLVMQFALGTSLATVVVTGSASAHKHYKLDHIDWHAVKWLAPVLMPVTFISSQFVSQLPKKELSFIFASVMALLAIRMFLSGRKRAVEKNKEITRVSAIVGGTMIGIVSSAAGIGGGSLIVPFLHERGLPMAKAIGSSAVCSTLLAFSGAISYAIVGWQSTHMEPYAIGYVYIPALIGITMVSFFTSKIGAGLTDKLPTSILKKTFAVLLCFIAFSMFYHS